MGKDTQTNMQKISLNNDVPQRLSLSKRYAPHIAIFACLVLIFLAAYGIKTYQHNQEVLKAKAIQKLISSLRTQALQAQINGDLDKTELLYTQALSEAEKSGSSADMIEFLSRLVQVKIKNHKLGQTIDLVQLAVALAMAVRNAHASNSGIATWLDDMANAFHSRGENSTREDIKRFCMKNYLDIKLPTEDRIDRYLKARSFLFDLYLTNSGNYSEAVKYAEMDSSYSQRTQPSPVHQTSTCTAPVYLYVLASQLDKAKLAYDECRKSWDSGKRHGDDALFNECLDKLTLGHIKVAEGDLQAAEPLYKRALDLQKQYSHGHANDWLVKQQISLGLLEQRMGKLDEASECFRQGLGYLKECPRPEVTKINNFLFPDNFIWSGQVVCLEHLAQILSKQGKLKPARQAQTLATAIRSRNPRWAECKNPDPEKHYFITGVFPWSIDFLPTHIRFSFQSP